MNTKFYTIQIEVNTKLLKKRIRGICKFINIITLIFMIITASTETLSLGEAWTRTGISLMIMMVCTMIIANIEEE